MHIPDGFLSTPVWAALDAVCVPAVSLLASRARREADELRIPLLGVMGAFVFAAQMINFPVGLGTSGHLVGGALLAIVLGPASAALVMTAILAIQAFVFQDGGIVVLGANVLNMAIAGVFAGYLPYHLLRSRSRPVAIFLGAFLSVAVSASLAVAELLLSGVPMPGAILGVSAGLFAVSAALEGAITVAVVRAIERLHPGWVGEPTEPKPVALIAMGVVAVLLAAAGVVVASQSPDGLEKLAHQIGISERARALLSTPLADYEIRGLGNPWLSKAAAGLAGVGLIWVACLLMGRLIRRRRGAAGGA